MVLIWCFFFIKMIAMNKIAYFFRKNWIRFVAALVVGIIFVVIYLVAYQNAVNKGDNKLNVWILPEYYRDGLFIAGMIVIFMGALAVVANFGIFDIFAYYPARKKKENGKKENFGDYVERKRLERSSNKNPFYLPYFIVGALFLIASLILLFVLL